MLGNDDGAVTVETAIATGALIAVFTTLVAGLVAVGAHLAAIDIAGAAAGPTPLVCPTSRLGVPSPSPNPVGWPPLPPSCPAPWGPKPPALSFPSNKNSERHERAHHLA